MSPFDAARYARLLEGLEISEIQFSEAVHGTATARIDPEYFNRSALETLARLKQPKKLGDLVKTGYRVVYESTEAIDRVEGEKLGLPYFLQAADITTPFINVESMGCVQESDWIRYPMGRVKPGELLIEVKGKAEKIALVPEDFPKRTLVTGSCFKLSTRDEIDQYFLAAYLTCRYGQILKNRLKTNLLISYLAKNDLYSLPVPDASPNFKERIREVFVRCFEKERNSQIEIRAAESSLLDAIGLVGWQAPEPLSYVHRSRDAFASGRLDAQHFQPRFRALTDFIKATGQGACLADWLNENQRGKQPEYVEDGLPVVNSKHVLRGEVRLDGDNRNASFADDDLLIRHGDVLMNGTGVGTIGRVAPYLHAYPAIPDNHVTILRPKQGLDAVYLSVYLNSMPGQWQVDERLRGSSGQIELYPTDIAQFTVWIAPPAVQKDIRRSVEKSYDQKQCATRLLEAARRAVEIAVEDSEIAALKYLEAFK